MKDQQEVNEEVNDIMNTDDEKPSFGEVLRKVNYVKGSTNTILWMLAIFSPVLFMGIASNWDMSNAMNGEIGAFAVGSTISVLVVFYLAGKNGKGHARNKFKPLIDIEVRITDKRAKAKSVKNVKGFLKWYNHVTQKEHDEEYTQLKLDKIKDKIDRLEIKNRDKKFRSIKWWKYILIIPAILLWWINRYSKLISKRDSLKDRNLRDNKYARWRYFDIMTSNSLKRNRIIKKGRTEGQSNPESKGWIKKIVKLPLQIFGININMLIAVSLDIPTKQIIQFYAVFGPTLILGYAMRFDKVRNDTETEYYESLVVIESMLDDLLAWIENPVYIIEQNNIPKKIIEDNKQNKIILKATADNGKKIDIAEHIKTYDDMCENGVFNG
jgi:hypothetical protein